LAECRLEKPSDTLRGATVRTIRVPVLVVPEVVWTIWINDITPIRLSRPWSEANPGSTVARPKQQHPTNADPGGNGVLDYLRPFMTTTVGSKLLVALTGLALTGFVIGHLKIFGDPDASNSYAVGGVPVEVRFRRW